MSPAPVRTPWHLWLVAALALFWTGFGAFDFVMTLIRFEPYLAPFSKEMLDYFYAMPLWVWLLWAGSTGIGVAASVLMFLRSRRAVPAWIISVLCTVGSMIVSVVRPPPGVRTDALTACLIGGVTILFLIYAYWMRRRGVLA